MIYLGSFFVLKKINLIATFSYSSWSIYLKPINRKMKTKLFILSFTALSFSKICNAQERDFVEKQIFPTIDTTQSGVIALDSTFYLVDPIPDSTYWMVSPNPPYILDSNFNVEPPIQICGGGLPFEPDSMNYKYSGDDKTVFYWSKDKHNAPYYYLQVATDSSFTSIIYAENSLVDNNTIVINQPFTKAQFRIMGDTIYKLKTPRYYWRVGVDTQGWGLYFNEPNGENITWSQSKIYIPRVFGVCTEPYSVSICESYPNPVIDIINVMAMQGDLIEILNANGSVMVTTSGSEVSTNVINISQLKSGNYFLKITSAGDVKTSRIIKQ